jgi:hypothetical protein
VKEAMSSSDPTIDQQAAKEQTVPERIAIDKRESRAAPDESAPAKHLWLTSPVVIGVTSALFTVLGTGIGVLLQGHSNTQLERQKFESALILKALETTKKEDTANNLKFLLDAGLIQSLDKGKIYELAKTPANLPSGQLASAGQLTSTNPVSLPSRSRGNVSCANPPTTAILNYWPIDYHDDAEVCHDFPAIDAKLTNGQYSQNEDEWEAGRTAHNGDELTVTIWINNGAADNAEQLFPGHGIARNVRVATQLDLRPSSMHYVRVLFEGDNTNTVKSKIKINTGENESLYIVPSSGEVFDFTGTKILRRNFDMGNNTVQVGNLEPRFEDGRFLRFRVRVTN